MITTKDWKKADKLASALCYKDYPTQKEYIKALWYDEPIDGKENDIEEGKIAFKQSKKNYEILSKIFTDDEIRELWHLVEGE